MVAISLPTVHDVAPETAVFPLFPARVPQTIPTRASWRWSTASRCPPVRLVGSTALAPGAAALQPGALYYGTPAGPLTLSQSQSSLPPAGSAAEN